MNRQKILLGINTLTEVNQAAYMNHMILSYRLGRSYNKFDFGICAPRRMAIDNMRNFCAKAAIEGDFDYLWFIDDDVLVDQFALQNLLALKSDIAAGITLVRGYPYEPMLFSFDPKRQTPHLREYESLAHRDGSIRREDGLNAVGFSCCLIKTSLLEKVEPPWFLTGPGFTEDVFFCQRANSYKKNLTLAASIKVQTEHILGSETISQASRAARMKYDEAMNPKLLKKQKTRKPVVPEVETRFAHIRGVQLAEKYAPKKSA